MRYRVMSSLLVRWRRRTSLVLTTLLAAVSLTAACAKSPAEPSSAATTPTPNVSIVSMVVASETLVSGAHVYRVTVKLRESGGAAATIASIDLTFMNGSSVVASSHVERPISDTANILAANATMDSRETTTTDDDPSHPHATSVAVKANYTYGASLTRSADGSAEVPLSVAPTFTLSGVVTEENTAGRAVAGGMVLVVDGANAGTSSSTDGNGSYTLADLGAGSITIRATASGYAAAERAVTVAQDTRLDLRLLRTPVSAPPPPPPPPPPPSPGACAVHAFPDFERHGLQGRQSHGDDFEDFGHVLVAGQFRRELDHIPRRLIGERQRHAHLCGEREWNPELTIRHHHDFLVGRQRPTSGNTRTPPGLGVHSDGGTAEFRRFVRRRPGDGKRVDRQHPRRAPELRCRS